MLSAVDEARIRLYEQIRDVPTVDGGLLSDSGELVHVQQSQVDLKEAHDDCVVQRRDRASAGSASRSGRRDAVQRVDEPRIR
jgi:hypothetical protein